MAYSINGKVYTDHPLMDEIIHNCKLILNGIVVKNDVLANDNESEQSIHDSEVFFMIKDNTISYDVFPFTTHMLTSYGFSRERANQIVQDRYSIKSALERKSILEFCINYFINNFEETNNYYRMLIGLPPYGTTDYDIYIDRSYFPSNYKKDIDFSKPLHEFDNSLIAILYSTGAIENIRKEYKGSNYSYINFLGDKNIDLYEARKADKWDILYLPSVENLVQDRFKELYTVNKEMYLKRTYQEAYAFGSDYYEQIMILMLLCQTFNDMIVDTPEWYIRRDIFDIRSVQYFLESYGVEFFKEIPLKYQIRIVKNLNKLIKYKSSTKNCFDILDIFSLRNTSIFKYYLYKKRKTDTLGNYLGTGDSIDDYDLEFVQSKIDESYDDYIKDNIYRTPYDDITYQDKYWDGEDTHQYIKEKHLNRDFTIEPSKYMSIEYIISSSEYSFQLQYFLGLLLDSNIDTEDIKIHIPSIDPTVSFKLSDLFILLFLLTNGYDNVNAEVKKPKTIENAKEKPEFTKYDDFNGGYSYTPEEEYDLDPFLLNTNDNPNFWNYDINGGDNVFYSEIRSVEDFYDWMKKQYPEMFIEDKNRVYGFNTDADLEQLQEIVGRRHSRFQFDRGYTLEELGVDKFINLKSVSTIDDLVSIYENNKKCHDKLMKFMMEDVDNRDDRVLMDYVYRYLFTKPFDEKFYTLSNGKSTKYLYEVLEDRDYILYNLYLKAVDEINIETRQDIIRSVMNDIVNTLEYYLSSDSLEYIFSFTSIASFTALVRYIYLMINFFKSYKVHFIDPYITIIMDNRRENSAEAYDTIAEKEITYWKEDRSFQRDNAELDVFLEFEDNYRGERIVEILDVYGHFEPDPDDDYDYNGMYANSDETEDLFKDANGGYASDSSCIPFKMINGGSAQGSRRDLWDINGAGALEMQDYLIVDGGVAYDEEEYYRGDYHTSAFNYILDGGSAGTNQFISKSMNVKVIDRQITAEVKVSSKIGNALEVTDDGLYLRESWVKYSDFEEFQEDALNTYNYYSAMYQELSEDIKIYGDEESLDKRIQKCISLYLGTARKVVSYMDNDAFENNLKQYTDDKVQALYDEFYGFTPYEWGDF